MLCITSTGNYEGFVNYGSDILPSNKDKVAIEAYESILVGLQGHWKCPIGYSVILFCNDYETSN